MKENKKKRTGRRQRPCQRAVRLPCGTVTYRLLKRGSEYWVECALGQERAFVPLGKSIAKAACMFKQLVAGGVTPCTAADVVADLRAV